VTPEEEQYAADIYGAMMRWSNYSVRALQGREFQAGISDLGFCSERVRRMLDQQVPEDTDVLAAFIGTALGDHAEQAVKTHLWPDCLIQAEVKITFDGDQLTYTLTGHPDIVKPDELLILDGKTDLGLSDVQRHGASRQQQFQRHLYGKAAFDSGLFPQGTRLEDVRVGNFWIDRSAQDQGLEVEVERYDPDVVREASEWLDEVTYAYINEQEARKEPPRQMCEKVCGFFKECRLFDTDVEGLITDDHHLELVDQYLEGQALAREGERLKRQAKAHLEGVQGSTGTHLLRWTWVNPTVVSEFSKNGYWKIDVVKIGRKK
jgi:hypothetical protein